MRYPTVVRSARMLTVAPPPEPGLKRERNKLMLIRYTRHVLLLALAVSLVALVGGPALGISAPARKAGKVSKLKQIQRRLITEEEGERIRDVRAALRRGVRPEARSEPARDEGFAPGEEQARLARAERISRAYQQFRTQVSLAPNVRANDRSTDVVTCPGAGLCSTQSEESIAAWRQYVLVAWNDGEK